MSTKATLRDGSVVESQLEPHLRRRGSSGGALSIAVAIGSGGSPTTGETIAEHAVAKNLTSQTFDVCANQSCRDYPLVMPLDLIPNSYMLTPTTGAMEFYNVDESMEIAGQAFVIFNDMANRNLYGLDVVMQSRHDSESYWKDCAYGARRIFQASTLDDVLTLSFNDTFLASTHVRFVLRATSLDPLDVVLTSPTAYVVAQIA